MAEDANPSSGEGPQDPVCREVPVDVRETVAYAVEAGYYEVPRRTSLVELADELDVSDRELSERLREGVSALVRDE